MFTTDEISKQIDDSQCIAVVTIEGLLEKVVKAVNTAKYGKDIKVRIMDDQKINVTMVIFYLFQEIIVIRKLAISTQLPPKCIDFKSVVSSDTHGIKNVRKNEISFDVKNDIVLLPYSSGTTGPPKGVVLTHYNYTSIFQSMDV